ncbi:MAG: DUF3320 domain-containing protein [Candidatus Latescibacteria bacterium]|nr:DUF3320 domain-containing protein [Candidatus Latescibacterota bacterium]
MSPISDSTDGIEEKSENDQSIDPSSQAEQKDTRQKHRTIEHRTSTIALWGELDHSINYAMQQNDVPIIKGLKISNSSAESLLDLQIGLKADPSFSSGWSSRVERIDPGETYSIGGIDMPLSSGFLGGLTERVRGTIEFSITHGQDCLLQHIEPVELLARDEWPGISSLPEILASFVLPNNPSLNPILSKTAEILGNWTGDTSLSGYQTGDPRRVYITAAAVYTAIQDVGLTYINPPASFGVEGQRIRLPDQILEAKMGTCLDLAVLAASCLEQIGLHALLILVKGHAFTGFWLYEGCFGEPAIDDLLRLRKRVDLREIGVFDPTLVTQSPAVDYVGAEDQALRCLEDPNEFLCLIDICRARIGRIRPLPEQGKNLGEDAIEEAAIGESSSAEIPGPPPILPDLAELPAKSTLEEGITPIGPETPTTRLDRWRRRLLDLSLRNNLLNFKDTKKTIPLLCHSLAELEDALANGHALQVGARPQDLGPGDPRDMDAHRRRTGFEALAQVLGEELKAKRLYADLAPAELDRRLIEVYRDARLRQEEGGASALYLAIGFLSWYENETSEQQRLAPILLLPLEVRRKSIQGGFQLAWSEEDIRVNVTLLEMLKQDWQVNVPGVDPLPEDEAGIDVPLILRTFRQAVLDIDRWDVADIAQIGFFSFTKFLMWRDLSERAEDLLKNAVVDHLVNRPEQPFESTGDFPKADRLDEERPPTKSFCPLSADSSQLAAVFAAAEGQSFVLEGPPGTGKSQTITNLIAHCLSEGKTVLFVSEKMAALNVVYRRLENVGLGRFCLELHSNKSHKREVVGQLEESLVQSDVYSTEEWERQASQLENLRAELNTYVRALHRRRSTGETVFQATSYLIGLRDVQPVALQWDTPDAFTADQLAEIRVLVERTATAGAACGDLKVHPWIGTRRSEWTPGWQDEVASAVEHCEQAIQELQQPALAVSQRLEMGEGGWSLSVLGVLDKVAELMIDAPGVAQGLLTGSDWGSVKARVDVWIVQGRRRDALRDELYRRFSERIITLNLDHLRQSQAQAVQTWWPLSWWRLRPVMQALQDASKGGSVLDKDELPVVLEHGIELRDLEKSLKAIDSEAGQLLGSYWIAGNADWEQLEIGTIWADTFRALAAQAAGDNLEKLSHLREHWGRLATEGRELLGPNAAVGRELGKYRVAFGRLMQARDELAQLLSLDETQNWGTEEADDALGRMSASVQGWKREMPLLREWCAWQRTRGEAVQANLKPLIEAYENGYVQSPDLSQVFDRSYAQWWLNAVVDNEPVLADFFSPEHERKIEQFRNLDETYGDLTSKLIQARLAERVPASGRDTIPNSEMGILKREIGKKRRHLPVRQLLQKIPNILPRLKPCLLMSPMSVAQYLDANYPPFDLVVFDEASQIPVWDSVGALARGKQAIIVGDPKQLPPTNFFQRSDDEDDDDEDMVQDLESILDDCIGAQIPWLSLNWHYRSRHESLIAFSNYHYYDNRLLTFPSPDTKGMGVVWRYIEEGVYDKGKSRTNRAEADAVVGEIVQRLQDPNQQAYTIGVVTFSQAQQTLIEDLLDQARLKQPSLDAFFGEEATEPVFIKNLENVQGDERDVILFSICYGPDAQGRVSMNFGPMNRDGGERRLNVAITRARREVLVFSTLRADQIDLTRTRAQGVRDLKNFLEYAERGPSAIAETAHYDPDANFDSPFEEAVHKALVAKGWEVHKQVGCSGYRMDLAVVDPKAPGRYLLGIECDGANYHRAKTARDRDRLRESVLRDLGWEIQRIWSTDWWTNPEKEIQKVEVAIEEAKRGKTRPPAKQPQVEVEIRSEHIAAAPEVEETDSRETVSPETDNQVSSFPIYEPFIVDTSRGTVQDFGDYRSEPLIQQTIAEVVQNEGPITFELTARRVSAFWGFSSVRAKTEARIRALIPIDRVTVQATAAGDTLWGEGQVPEQYTIFRVPGDGDESNRSAEHIPVAEAANAVLYLLTQHISIPTDTLIREAGKLFGFQRTGRIVKERMQQGIDWLLERGAARAEEENVVLGGLTE